MTSLTGPTFDRPAARGTLRNKLTALAFASLIIATGISGASLLRAHGGSPAATAPSNLER
jgi:hypothetical protein